jgi:SAM-dependent methyltransferase
MGATADSRADGHCIAFNPTPVSGYATRARMGKSRLLLLLTACRLLEVEFGALVTEGAQAPVEGWDFSWFEGRATEQRPSWGYAVLLSEHLSHARSALDIQTGGGEVFAWAIERASRKPGRIAATESWPPNAALASSRLAPLGAGVLQVANDEALPFVDEAFDLVSSRHPVTVVWKEVARVIRKGATFVSQMVGAGSNRELHEYLMGPQLQDSSRSPEVAVADANSAGLQLVDFREETLEVAFFDIGAVVHFLRKVPWTVSDFTVERYYDRLADLHAEIGRDGRFVSHSRRYLIELRK